MESQNQNKQFSLKQSCKQRLKSLIQMLKFQNKGIQWFIMVVDKSSLKILSSFIKQTELQELDIWCVDQLENERKPHPQGHVIYFITPCQESIDLVKQDFSKKSCMYGKVHLLTTNKIQTSLMNSLSENEYLLDRIVTFKEYNQEFCCRIDNSFNLEMPEALVSLFTEQDSSQFLQIYAKIAQKLATVVTSVEKFHSIEILFNKAKNGISEQVAMAVYDRLNEIIGSLQKEENQETLDPQAGKITILIIDRSFDALTPLLHDFFYQSMLYDLLDVQNDIVEYEEMDQEKKQMVKKKVVLHHGDELFKKYRFMHIAQVTEQLGQEAQQYESKYQNTKKLQQGETLELKDLSDIIKKMPSFQQQMAKFNLHVQLVDKCFKILNEKSIYDIGELEQTLATGLNDQNEKVKSEKLVQMIATRLQSDKLDKEDILRLILISIICINMVEKDRKELTSYLPQEDYQAVLNLIYLGINPQNTKTGFFAKSKKRIEEKQQKIVLTKQQKQTLKLCRNFSQLEILLEELYKSNNINDFVKVLPENIKQLKINEKSQTKSNKQGLKLKGIVDNIEPDNFQKPKTIILMVGGISYNELRAIQNLECFKDQIIMSGGTEIITPKSYIQSIKKMKPL